MLFSFVMIKSSLGVKYIMKLLLCSDFSGVGYKYVKKFFSNTKGLRCLFIGYAQEDEEELESGGALRLKNMGINVVSLTKNYEFNEKIDIIFVRGGNTTRLLHYLREYNQFDKIKALVETNDILYIGSSAGAVLCGTDTEWTLPSEPYEFNLKSLYGENALLGFGWIKKLVFVHCNKYRLCWSFEKQNENDIFRTLDKECYPAFLEDKKIYKRHEYLKINNNQAYLIDGESEKMYTYNWSHLPIKIIED